MSINNQEEALLSKEIELLMQERGKLLKVVGAAAVLIANANTASFSAGALDAAERLSEALNNLAEETLQDSLDTMLAQPK